MRVPFYPVSGSSFKDYIRMMLKNYFEVPPDIIENSDELIVWARQAATIKSKNDS